MANDNQHKRPADDEPFCWEIKNCRPTERERCSAYNARKNCWKVAGTALDRGGNTECETCPVILSRIARAIARAMSASAGCGER